MKKHLIAAVVLAVLLLTACSFPVGSLFLPQNEVAAISPSGWDEPLLSAEEAKQIALHHAKLTEEDVDNIHVSFKYDDGNPEYEVHFRSPYFFHEYEIHGISGRIISSEREK